MAKRVAVLGGGVAGLSAAHELIRRGFNVDVYEASDVAGGKARSLDVPNSGTGGRPDLPGEHGFRFFPGFYKHLPATMEEIQVGLVTAADHLVSTNQTLLARQGGKESILAPNQFPTNPAALIQAFRSFTLLYCDLGVPKSEVSHFIRCLLKMLISCDGRRFEVYEKESWFDFLDAGNQSAAFQKYLVKGLSRSLVALNADELSARTGACILLQFLMDFTGFTPLDRVLDLPTNEAWLTPWHDQLINDGVQFHWNSPVESIQCSGGLITGVLVKTNGVPTTVTADYYIAAVPVEKMQKLLNADMTTADKDLASIMSLRTEWMTGIIFFLKKDVSIVEGHANYLDSDWALTSISQPQFWPTIDMANYGDGTVRGVLSVIISNWGPALFGGGTSAKDCDPDQVIERVWQQLKDHLNNGGTVLEDGDRVTAFLAPCLKHDSSEPIGQQWSNDEPLFINTKGSWEQRPRAVTKISNFFLASDYVRTYTDLATMESANEAARRAVNGILDREASPYSRCDIWPLDEPILLIGARLMDATRYHLFGLPPLVPLVPTLPWPCL